MAKKEKQEKSAEEIAIEEKTKKTVKKKEKTEEEKLLIPLDDYIKAAIHLGTKAITPAMRQFVYKRRGDGIAVINTKKIDKKIALAASFLSRYSPEEIMVSCKRDAGHKALVAFGNATGVRVFKRYPAGLITNPFVENFFEPKIILVVDPWLDRNAIRDAVKIKIPIIALCDTNNSTEYIDFIIPCNNKTDKSIGLIFYLIAKLYLANRGIKKKIDVADFCPEEKEEKTQEQESDEKLLTKKLKEKT